MKINKKDSGWLPTTISPADIRAVQDLERGQASEDQQKRVLSLIIENLCATYMPSYRENDRDTIFMEGRRFVGLELITMLKINASKLRSENEH